MAEDKEKEQLHRATAKYSKVHQNSTQNTFTRVAFHHFVYRDLLIGELFRHG